MRYTTIKSVSPQSQMQADQLELCVSEHNSVVSLWGMHGWRRTQITKMLVGAHPYTMSVRKSTNISIRLQIYFCILNKGWTWGMWTREETHSAEQVGVAVMPQTCIKIILSSNFTWVMIYLDCDFSYLSLFSPGKCWYNIFKEAMRASFQIPFATHHC
jgi:hypothetical protein